MKKHKIPVQKNHDGCFLPKGMETCADMPVYIIVALWCLKKNSWVNRRDIARDFKINERKASYYLSYIMKKENIEKEVRMVRNEGSSVNSYEVKVNDVTFRTKKVVEAYPAQRRSGGRKNLVGNATEKERQLLRNLWFSVKK
ncbi:CaiF/GrlA family transcriptional regulator (plasmid) [Salmonella enterica subsp. diarizonae]|uniref:CaiF/GrlA family transcriptional regulator n=1 Tax=Salmonella diarizonae TaxID=59204 RepID=A0A8E9ZSJ5_SALDZ|nr:CaiF/GrlA family transcriptional regulator [Salmonella enterica]EAX3659596.1 CaiF/GrlA family transcriptional regulator [Salmonella enterica]EAY8342568.1 CaiF/GrlA family transcriptional regulator [Salmonella enterica]EBQ1069570.1 CaiF/GrlA family transcriptional regulator [Salmonella enterica]QWJ71801.1 CaiF/GrlA family transcriptional regulator [Salmonella enterica subsp. diarizonae]